ncbi:glucose-1-phosphate thymidylyltransferase RfbA [Marivibrio halodurans]|uniref:Glucose-1-phosphate thymidylyltransferase n=1 Tax=Marivibrio halodurans TaxID=2039722 RepID=A0A8J7V149_9PROT|nr:glucose-1-phosphate thymidylyltransferase RfbA [Marivibrio halodurans]MBP5857431.1 glucose-1-phosphate thymidylyltransferase RfbA [Marivibrio halodurans]
MRRGVLLAGGLGTRLLPATAVVNKHLLPVHNKPMIYYPLSVLMLAGIREILIISTPRALPLFRDLLGDGGSLGVRIAYKAQPEPRGIAEAMILAEDFLDGAPSMLMLGDNLLYAEGLPRVLRTRSAACEGACLFAYPVRDPERFGVVSLDGAGRVRAFEEKPAAPRSNLAAIGLYLFDPDAPARAAALTPSARGELEITDLARGYLDEGRLDVECFGRGVAWLDMGTPASISEASEFVRTIEDRQGLLICAPEEIAWRNGWIDDAAFAELADRLAASPYGAYLRKLLRADPMDRGS